MNFMFRKYHGAGNDFVLFYHTPSVAKLTRDAIQKICDRRYGVGSDGILWVEVLRKNYLKIDFYNPDGSESFCGNGARCALRMAFEDGKIDATGNFWGNDGEHSYEVFSHDVEISMAIAEYPVMLGSDWYVNTGSPHYVMFRDGIDQVDMLKVGREIRYGERWKEKGVNVNIAEWQSNVLNMRTYERGVEDETLSCGTGVTAAAICAANEKPDISELAIKTRGGSFVVRWLRLDDGSITNVRLRGPAQFVFEGYWTV